MGRIFALFALVILLVSGLCEGKCRPSKCVTKPGYGARQLCGSGKSYCKSSNLYECDNRGKCCSYGYRKSCAKCKKLRC